MQVAELIESFSLDASSFRDSASEEWEEKVIERHREFGAVLLRGLLRPDEVNHVRSQLTEVIGLALSKLRDQGKIDADHPLANPDRFDEGMIDLLHADRGVGGEVFRVARKLMSVQRLVLDERFESIASALMGHSPTALYPLGTNVRADHPDEDHFLYPWHQDYLYNLGSEDGQTFWAPLVDVDDVNGCLLLAPGSHREGVLPVVLSDPLNRAKNSASAFSIANLEEILARYQAVSVPMAAGDALVFDCKLLHSSQANRSRATRWSLQFRYFNVAAPEAVRRGWPGGMAEGVDFTEFHPEVVVPASHN